MYVARYKPGDTLGTNEVMGDLGVYLLKHGLIICEDGCGVQDGSEATCVFEVHVIKKRV